MSFILNPDPDVIHAVTETDIPAGGTADLVINGATTRIRRTGLPHAANDVVFPAVAAERLVTGDCVAAEPDHRGTAFLLTQRRNLTPAEIEGIAAEDPDDRQIRFAHGFYRDDDWQDSTLLCRNGCGLPYSEVVAGKVRRCLGPERTEGPA
ncbi:hypothetical protein [Micromonospora sediminicola]|uniref:hypothetical protein n=1 Tax=Micromonospora sediminicola TaxID=946078 RepID=UPI0037A79B7E